MSPVPQIIIALLIWMVVLGGLINPDLRTYSAQLIALLLLFYIIVRHMMEHFRKNEVRKAREDETTLLFLSTFLKPKLEHLIDLTHYEENQEVVQKQLELVDNEVSKYLEDKEKEVTDES